MKSEQKTKTRKMKNEDEVQMWRRKIKNKKWKIKIKHVIERQSGKSDYIDYWNIEGVCGKLKIPIIEKKKKNLYVNLKSFWGNKIAQLISLQENYMNSLKQKLKDMKINFGN